MAGAGKVVSECTNGHGPMALAADQKAARYFTPHRAPIGNTGPVIAVPSSPRFVAIAGVAS